MTEHAGWAWRSPRQLDWQRRRVVVFESDDWGSCERARDAHDLAQLDVAGDASPWLYGTLESPADMARLYETLETVRGADGQPACFTGFVCVANPDFEAIRADGFQRYHEIPVHRGTPASWARGDISGAWRDGERRGVFACEYHTRLHHTQPDHWLALLRDSSDEGEAARQRFDRHCFALDRHLPEYAQMTPRQQHGWVEGGVRHFIDAVGRRPRAAVTSDATPVTEVIWAAHGIGTFSLKNSRLNSGETVVYHTKPWNSQDVYCPLGARSASLDMVYLARNVQFECGIRPETQDVDAALSAVRAAWARNEPAIINTHRVNYVSISSAIAERGFTELARLLQVLGEDQAHFLTSAEVGDLYRQGWSVRAIGGQRLVRNWSQSAILATLSDRDAQVVAIPAGEPVRTHPDDRGRKAHLPPGDYVITPSSPNVELAVECAPG